MFFPKIRNPVARRKRCDHPAEADAGTLRALAASERGASLAEIAIVLACVFAILTLVVKQREAIAGMVHTVSAFIAG